MAEEEEDGLDELVTMAIEVHGLKSTAEVVRMLDLLQTVISGIPSSFILLGFY